MSGTYSDRLKLTLSAICSIFMIHVDAQNSKNDPIENFESLWSEFHLRYANFESKSVDWQDIYDRYRPQITPTSTSNQLFDVSCKMLQELKDGHVTLKGKTDIGERDCGVPYTYHLEDEFGDIENLMPVLLKTLKTETFSSLSKKIGNGYIRYSTSSDYGYLIISDFEGFAIGEIKRSMKAAMKLFKNKKGLIIDIRLNGGGSDESAYKIAGRFTENKRLGHYKKTKIKGTKEFTELESWYLHPTGKEQFTKPIVVLTSDWSASAAEVFLLAMKELPYVTIVGNRTEGIFSDMFEFKLPNGWNASLSNMQFFSSKMLNFEGKGIEPDIKILNYKEDAYDNVLLEAIALLDKKTKN